MPHLSLFVPVKSFMRVGPRNLQHRERRPPVEPDGLSEEGPVPAQINLPERDLLTVDNVRMSLAAGQYTARNGLLSEPVENAVHDVNIESEHGELRCVVSVREADRVGESRADVVLRNHHDVPSVPLHVLDDRQIHAVRFSSVTVVMAEDAAALERIGSHTRRLRGEWLSRPAGLVITLYSNDTVTLCDRSPRSVPEPRSDVTVPLRQCLTGKSPVLELRGEISQGISLVSGQRAAVRRP